MMFINTHPHVIELTYETVHKQSNINVNIFEEIMIHQCKNNVRKSCVLMLFKSVVLYHKSVSENVFISMNEIHKLKTQSNVMHRVTPVLSLRNCRLFL